MTPDDIFAALTEFRLALSEPGRDEAPWAALQALSERLVGARLFTVMTVDLEAGVASRQYTNMPKAYPASGTKPITVTPWFEHVVLGRRMFVMETPAEIAAHLFDHELIASLGCGSCVNMPVAVGGKVLGTVNLLNPAGHLTPERLRRLEHLQVPAMAAFLAARAR
jgi:hypothetical protein